MAFILKYAFHTDKLSYYVRNFLAKPPLKHSCFFHEP
jgi:hypothetical protein